MSFILITLLSSVFYSFCNVIEAQFVNYKFKKITTMVFYISIMNCMFLPLLLFFSMPTVPPKDVAVLLLLIGVIGSFQLYPYYKALQKMDTSAVIALWSIGYVIMPFMGYFILGEVLKVSQYVGFFMVIVSSVILSIGIDDVKRFKLNSAFYYMIVVSVCYSFFVVLEKKILTMDDNWVNVVIYPMIVGCVVPSMALLFMKSRRDIIDSFYKYKKGLKFLVLNELFGFAAFVAAVYGLVGLSPVVSTAIIATTSIFTFLIIWGLSRFSKLKYQENMSLLTVIKKFVCFAMIICGVVLSVS